MKKELQLMRRREFLERSTLAALFAGVFSPFNLGLAQASARPRRFIALLHPNGMNWKTWATGAPNGSLVLGKSLLPLLAHKSNIVVVKGISDIRAQTHLGAKGFMNVHYNSHQAAWTGSSVASPDVAPRSPSIDVILEPILNKPGAHSLFQAGTQSGGDGCARYLSSRANQGLAPVTNPKTFFETVFPNGVPPSESQNSGTLATKPPEFGKPRTLSRKSLLDAMLADYKESSKILGAEAKRRLDSDMELYRQLESKLVSADAVDSGFLTPAPVFAAQEPAKIVEPDIAGLDLLDSANFLKIARLQLRTAMAAFRTDKGRILSFMYGGPNTGAGNCTWIPNDPILFPLRSRYWGKHYHGFVSHNDLNGGQQNSEDYIAETTQAFAIEIAALVQELKDTPEIDGQGTMFDNTTILWCSEVGNPVHSIDDKPYVIIAGANAGISTGKFIEANADCSDVLLTVANSFSANIKSVGASEKIVAGILKG
jgi:Protein of unknown function (DUF1552)